MTPIATRVLYRPWMGLYFVEAQFPGLDKWWLEVTNSASKAEALEIARLRLEKDQLIAEFPAPAALSGSPAGHP